MSESHRASLQEEEGQLREKIDTKKNESERDSGGKYSRGNY